MKSVFVLLVVLLVGLLGVQGKLRKNFYKKTCPIAEQLVQDITWGHVRTNPVLPAKLIRMHFHDCFVRGCDGSVLINSTAGNTAERDAIPNLSLAGFEVIEEIKAELEELCPGVVSCADILTLATRDSVSFQFQERMWEVMTGRRDGRISRASEANNNLPSPFMNFKQLLANFKNQSLTEHDLVVLSGGHTIGVAHCNLFSNRLYNFTGRGDQDPSLDRTYAAFLKTKCSPTDTTTTVNMDPGTPNTFDNSYYHILREKKGLFQSDAALLTDRSAAGIVAELTDSRKFFVEFKQAMEKMGKIGVLTENQGEIRTTCRLVNPSISMVTDM